MSNHLNSTSLLTQLHFFTGMVSPCLHRARIERILVAPTRTPLTSGIVVYNYWQVSGAEVRGKFVIRQPCPGREHFPCARAYTLPRGLRTDVNYYRQFRETNTPSTPSPVSCAQRPMLREPRLIASNPSTRSRTREQGRARF